jgi:hypothetical protein
MANQVYLYTAGTGLTAVDFLFFDSTGNLQDTEAGTLNIDNVWEVTVPALPAGDYTVVGKSGIRTLGKEEIRWDGTSIIPPATVIAKAVRAELSPELIHLVSLQNGLTAGQSTMLLELYRLMGLDPTRPLYVDKGIRTVLPEIRQTLDDDTLRTIVTRIP